MTSGRFHRNLNRALILVTLVFLVSFGVTVNRWPEINKSGLESRFFPALKDWTFVDWQQEEDGSWSAVAFVNKVRAECVYKPGQVLVFTGRRPDGVYVESGVTWSGPQADTGRNRPTGWQQLNRRMKIDSVEFVPGTVFSGTVLHQCHEGTPTATAIGPFVVGQDGPLTPQITAWLDNDRVGDPKDY